MRLKPLTTIALVLLTALLPVLPKLAEAPVQAQMAEPTWEPIAQINPQKPYQVQLVNETAGVLEFASTTNEFPPRTLRAGASTSLTRLPVPIYLLISSVDSASNVRYVVSARQNVITVRVRQLAAGRLGLGHSTLNIQETGGVYAY